jgi:catechol-2,3-dioxygenase
MTFPALNHVAVTVRDLEVSQPWYQRLIGADPVLDEDTDAGFHHVVWAFGDGTLFGIHQHTRAQDGDYTEFQPGLDHVGFGCASRADLQEWENKLNELGVAHGGIVDAHYGSGLEFFAPPE